MDSKQNQAPLSSDLADKVTLITGASSGIGAATAVLFSRLGAQLAITGRNEANLQKVRQQCEQQHATHKPLLIIADLSKEEDTRRVLEETIKHYGKLDVLVNNAGIQELGSIETVSLEQYDKVMNINVRSVLHLTHLAAPYLIKTKGNIVNVSSVAGLRAFPGLLSYCISKSAVDQFTRATALELAPKQVRVNCVNPGVIVTELQKKAGLTDEQYAQLLERSKQAHPLGRAGEVDEVAHTIAFLASEAASFITGAQIPVDGGKQVACPR